MADARPTFPLSPRYTLAQTEAVQPPDDRTYSAEVTSFNEQSPASSQCAFRQAALGPYTRLNSIPCLFSFVKHFFGKNYKVFSLFLVIIFSTLYPFVEKADDHFLTPCPYNIIYKVYGCSRKHCYRQHPFLNRLLEFVH